MKVERYKKENLKKMIIAATKKDRFDLIPLIIEIINQIQDESIGDQEKYGSIKVLRSNVEYIIEELAK